MGVKQNQGQPLFSAMDDNRADWFRNKYFGEQDIVTLDTNPKFHMNEENDPFFQKYVTADTTDDLIRKEMRGKLKKDSNFLLLHAITALTINMQQRQSDISSSGFHPQTLLDLQAYLQESVSILLLKVEDEADAYVIFETLNDRGRSLTTMDLLKNHVFGKSQAYLDQVKAKWTVIKNNLADIDPNERFLYHYWTSRHGRTSKTHLFRLMRAEITNARSALSFVEQLNEGAKLYAALTIPNHPYWNSYDQRTRNNLDTLTLLDAQQALPILLAAAQEFPEDEFGKLTDILVIMAVRYNLIGELRTGVAANYYSEVPKKIRNGDIRKSAKVFRELRSIYPKDDEFKAAFSTKVLRNSRKARYLLAEIEKHLNAGVSQIVNDTRAVNLEHILPKNPSQQWSKTVATMDVEEVDEYINRIGNLALVSSTVNKNVGTSGFERRKEKLFQVENHIQFSKKIADYEEWTKLTIEDRQTNLAEIAVNVWSIDIR